MTQVSYLYLASDLASRRKEVLQAARQGQATVRDTDGFTLTLLPQADLERLEETRAMVSAFFTAESGVLRKSQKAAEFGEFAWISVFDQDDRDECLLELKEAIALLLAGDEMPLRETVRAWRLTAQQLSDPRKREVLLGVSGLEDFTSVEQPA